MADNLVYDYVAEIIGGMDSGNLPRLLNPDKAAFAFNATFRGGFPTDRPKVRKIALTYDPDIQSAFETGLWQGGAYFKPDIGSQSLVASVSGRLFKFTPDTSGNATVSEITIPSDPNSATNPQAWGFQAESWLIWNDGTSLPMFYDGNTIRRSYGPSIVLGTTTAGPFTIPAVNSNVTLTLLANYTGPLNVVVSVGTFGTFLVVASGTPPASGVGYSAFLSNINDTPGNTVAVGTPIIVPAVTNIIGTVQSDFNVPTNNTSVITITLSSQPGPLTVGKILTIAGRNYRVHSLTGFSNVINFTCNDPASSTVNVPVGTSVYDTSITPAPSYTFGTVEVAFVVPAVSSPVTAQLSALWTGAAGTRVTVGAKEYFLSPVTQTSTPSTTLIVKNLTGNPSGPAIVSAQIQTIGELPIGRMGVYGLGRACMSLIDGISFTMSDLVGESSGSSAYNFRDAVLKVTKNAALTNGKPFRVPNSGETIQGMSFIAQLDVALGNGPLQVFTDLNVFSCQAPINSSIWATLTSPILTESLKGSGGISQESLVNSNADIFFRSPDAALRSFKIARLDFDKWGNTPISHEMQRVLIQDNLALTNRSSGVEFDNRLLQAVNPIQGEQGVYHRGLMVINFDQITSLAGKTPSTYDGLWTGLQIFRIITGKFFGANKCYAFCFNSVDSKIELWEMLRDGETIFDEGLTPVIWGMESADLFRGQKGELIREFKALEDGEISLDDVQGDVTVDVFYKPDQYPGWILWKKIQVSVDMTATDAQPGYFTRLGLGRPNTNTGNVATGQNMRFGYTFQTRKVIQGHCRCIGDRYVASLQPEPKPSQPLDGVKRIGVPVPPLDDFAIFNLNGGVNQMPA